MLFLFQAQVIDYVDYIAAVLTNVLSALLEWELFVLLTNRFIVVAS